MPYFGLLDHKGTEVSGDGYHRLDAGSILYHLSPSEPGENHQVCFLNSQPLAWTAEDHWGSVEALGLYDEVDSLRPFGTADINPSIIRRGDKLIIPPGDFRLGTTLICERNNKSKGNEPSIGKMQLRIDKLVRALLIARAALRKDTQAYRVVEEALEQ